MKDEENAQANKLQIMIDLKEKELASLKEKNVQTIKNQFLRMKAIY